MMREQKAVGGGRTSGRGPVHTGVYFVLLSLLLLHLGGCSDKVKPGSAEVKRQAVTGVTVTEVEPVEQDEYYEASGTVKARTVSVVASRIMGTVTSLKVHEGERVRAGQLLMTVDDRDIAQRVKAAEKALDAAKQQQSLADVTYQRYRKLHDEKAISLQEIDQVETQKKIADSEYEKAAALLDETRITRGFSRIGAPGPGVVVEKRIEVGSMAVPGTPLLVVEDTSSYRVETSLDESMSGRVRIGMPVDVVIDSLGRELKGRIAEITPSIDELSRTFPVKIEIKGAGLRTGQYAKVRVPSGRREALLVPDQAVVEKGQLTGVYVVEERGVIVYRLVRPGRTSNGMTEILSGLNPKDKVITGGVERAVDGGRVTAATGSGQANAGTH
ncbi:MAG: efflux RND transporter periplasmic adaptor subunit [Thermodesulfovibrionales bacterium]